MPGVRRDPLLPVRLRGGHGTDLLRDAPARVSLSSEGVMALTLCEMPRRGYLFLLPVQAWFRWRLGGVAPPTLGSLRMDGNLKGYGSKVEQLRYALEGRPRVWSGACRRVGPRPEGSYRVPAPLAYATLYIGLPSERKRKRRVGCARTLRMHGTHDEQ